MKLARILHLRCNEYDATTLVWIPEDWTLRKFNNAVARATNAYLDYIKQFAAENPPVGNYYNFGYSVETQRDEYPETMTIGEARAKYEAEKKIQRDWQEAQSKIKQGLRPFLVEEGMVDFWSGLEDEHIFETDIDWLHRHGTAIDYDETLNIQDSYLAQVDEYGEARDS